MEKNQARSPNTTSQRNPQHPRNIHPPQPLNPHDSGQIERLKDSFNVLQLCHFTAAALLQWNHISAVWFTLFPETKYCFSQQKVIEKEKDKPVRIILEIL